MNVHRIPIDRFRVLRELAAALEGATIAPNNDPIITLGDWPKSLDAQPWNGDRDVAQPKDRCYRPLRDVVECAQAIVGPDVEVRASHFYPVGGGMGWHTNSNGPGWRIYVVRALGPGVGSGMLTPGVFHHDMPGHANAFRIGDWRDSWHAVHARGCSRLSVGIRLTDGQAAAYGLEASS